MALPYRVIQLKNNVGKQKICINHFPRQNFNEVLGKSLKINESRLEKGRQKLGTAQELKVKQRSAGLWDHRLSLSLDCSQQAKPTMSASIDLSEHHNSPKSKRKKLSYRPLTSISLHQSRQKRQRNKIKEQPKTSRQYQKTKRYIMQDSECIGWNVPHTVYEHSKKEFCFNLSKTLEKQRCVGRSIDPKQQKSINKKLRSQTAPKINQDFTACIDTIKKKRKENSKAHSVRKIQRDRLNIVDQYTEVRDYEPAELISLEETYWQWRGYYTKKKQYEKIVKKNKLKNEKSILNKKESSLDKQFDYQVDGWQINKQGQQQLQEASNQENSLLNYD